MLNFLFLEICLSCKHKAKTISGTANTLTKPLCFLQEFQTSIKLVSSVCFQEKMKELDGHNICWVLS